MKDPSGTNQDLIAEINVLKKRIRELEQTSSEKIRKENERRARQLTVLNETSVKLTAELNLDALLHSIAQRALSLIGGAACNCYLYNPQTDLLEQVASAGTALIPSPKTRQRGEGMVGQVWVKGTPLLVNDYASWSERTRAYDSFPSRALVAAPFRLGTEILGVLNIMAPLPHQYTQMDVEMLSLFAAQVAIAIRNARLYDQMKLELAERKKTEEALWKSEEKFRTIFDRAGDGILIADSVTKKFLQGNATICSMLGYTKEEIESLTIYDIHPPEDISLVLNEFDKQVKGEKVLAEDLPVLRKDGSIFYADISSAPATIEGTHCLVGMFRDITESKKSEEKEKETANQLKTLFESNPTGMMLVNARTRVITSANLMALHIMDQSEEEVIGQVCHKFVCPAELYCCPILDKGQSVDRSERVLIAKNYKQVPILKTVVKVNINNELYLLESFIDITERKRTEEKLQQTLESLRKAVSTTIQVVVSTVEVRDPYTAGHQTRSADLARAIATEMGLSQEKIEGIRIAGSIHDIGKIAIPAEILSKPTKLTEIEFSLIKEHARQGYEILKNVKSQWPLAEIVYQHHERMDGSGYPRNLKGDDILIEARILAVSDVVEAMASHRPYRPGLGIDAALKEIEKNGGIFYDNAIADACLRLFREKGFQLPGT